MSKIEVDAIEPQSGTSLTLGASGDTITIPSGATLSSTDPLVFPAGTVSLPAITTTGDTNTGIFFPAADTIAFTEGGAEAMRITSDGNMGIGTTSPNSYVGQTALTINSGGVARVDLDISDTIVGTLISESTYLGLFSQGASTTLRFGTNNTERMRILSDGSVQINHTIREDVEMLGIRYSGNVANGIFINSNTTNASNALLFANDANGVVGSVKTTTSSTSFNTSSDYRLKENVDYTFDATTRLKQLKPARFNFIIEPNKTVDGFLAHEVQDIIPEAITGEKDKTETKEKVVVNFYGRVIAQNIEQADWEAGKILNEEGTSKYPVDSTWEASKVVPVYQGIDQSKLTPILTKALQEAIAKIEQLEARITTLENA